MQRVPTPRAIAFRWWLDALAGAKPPIHTEPHCGYFERRLVKGGPFVPASITLVQEVDEDGFLTAPERMVCEVAGQTRDPEEEWTWLAGRPISQERYMEMLAERFSRAPAKEEDDGRPYDDNAPY